jgi:hypothetical protein
MKNAKPRKNGFVMILVIFAFAAVGLWMTMLAFNSRVFLFQADRAYLESCRQNLIASGLSWSRKNADSFKTAAAVVLDTADMNINEASLSVTVISAKKGNTEVKINTSCAKGGQTLSSSGKFTIEVLP